LLGALLTRRATPFAHAPAASPDAEQRIAQTETQLQQTAASLRSQAPATGEAVRARAETFSSRQNVVHTAATDVVNQLLLEAIYLGVSEPLVRYVLAPEARKRAAILDAQAAAAGFMVSSMKVPQISSGSAMC
jgi:hypothetical protein